MSLVLLQLIGLFAMLAMLAFGGGTAVLPEMQRAAVEQHHWLSAKEFLDMFAISRAAPGSLIVLLVGLKAAGIVGAAVSFAAMFAPSCLAAHLLARTWHRAANSAWRAVLERAFAPIGVGLTFASGLALMPGTEHGWLTPGLTIASTAVFSATGINPIVLLGIGAATLLLVGQ